MRNETEAFCDKCGQPVDPLNSAAVYQAETGEMLWDLATLSQPRHLAPEGVCEGSPSRFQHITGVSDGRGFPAPTPQSISAWRGACCRINSPRCPGWCKERTGRANGICSSQEKGENARPYH
jgi:hypothetical protein